MEQNSVQEEHVSSTTLHGKISSFIISALVLLVPLFVIPSINFPFELSKIAFIATTVLVAFAVYLLTQIKQGALTFVKSPLVYTALLIPLIFIVASLASPNKLFSLFGQGTEVGTASFISVMVLLMILTSFTFPSKERIVRMFSIFSLAFILLAVFHILRLVFGPDFLSFGLLTEVTSNLVGKWNDLATFFSIGVLLSFLTLEYVLPSSLLRKVLNVLMIVGLFFLILINFTVGWYALAVCAVLVLVQKLIKGTSNESEDAENVEFDDPKGNMSVRAIVLIVLSVSMILFGKYINLPLSNFFEIQHVEVRPSFGATADITKSTLAESPVLGSGPNRFLNQFLAYKPEGINSSFFWNTEFRYGVGLIPTFLITTGALGFLAWIVFLSLFIVKGIRSLFVSQDRLLAYCTISSFLVSLYLWIVAFFYVPNAVILTLTFIFSGVFIASLVLNGKAKIVTIDSLKSTKKGMIMLGAISLAIVGSLFWMGIYTKQLMAGIYFQKSVVSLNLGGNLDDAREGIVKATEWDRNDIFHSALIEIDLIKMNQVLTQSAADDEETVAQIQTLLSRAVENGQSAVAIDPYNYQNYISLGRVYESVIPLGVQGAYDAALGAYTKAVELNPRNPALYLVLARLKATNGKSDEAKSHIAKALEVKSNYTEAVYLLSQIQVSEGDLVEATKSVEAAIALSPNDPTLHFQLGLLKYNANNYLGTVEAMSKAITLRPEYSNARYFLGLSLARLGKSSEAITHFETIQELNPDSEEVALILTNLRAGRQPFTNAEPPIDTPPESRKKLPVEDR